jgi:hypothetical protein
MEMPSRLKQWRQAGRLFYDLLMKRAMFLMGGVLWLGFALGFAAFLVGYIGGGAGLRFFGGPVSSGSVLLGLVHLVGFGTAILLCFAIGVGLCARGIVEKDRKEQDDGKVTE